MPKTHLSESISWTASRPVYEIDDGRRRLGRLLLHDPVAGIADDAGRHVGRDKSHYVAHLRAERMVPAQRQHRHGEIALSSEDLVVFGVLIEGRELVERRMHRTRARIK